MRPKLTSYMEIVIASDIELASSKVSRIADKRITQLIGAFPHISDIKFYIGKEGREFYYELTIKIKEESIYFKKYFTNLKFELIQGIQEIYDELYIRYEVKKNERYYKPIHLICIVEENKKLAIKLTDDLKHTFNTQIIVFSSPLECYYKLKYYKPDLIIMDYDFKEFPKNKILFENGLSAMKAIKRDYKDQLFLLMVNDNNVVLNHQHLVCISKDNKSMENLPLIIKEMVPNLPLNPS